ncbi:MAG TPA: L,D-transpeptidase family protein [Bryobacteraceae bacterium]
MVTAIALLQLGQAADVRRVVTASARSPTKSSAGPPSARLSFAAINNPNAPMPTRYGSSTVRAQIILDQSGFSVGEIDGFLGANTLHALAAYQQAHDLAATGRMDRRTWMVLNTAARPALVRYTVTEDDLKGPFTPIPDDLMAQSKLDYLGYSSPLEELAERYHCDPQILRALNPRTEFRVAGETVIVPSIRSPREAHAAKVVVSKSKSTVSAFDDQGKLISQYPASSGSEHDPLPLGEWKVTYIAKNPKFNYNPDLFWDAEASQAKAVIAPGPNNPVGSVWINLSKPHYGIHGTPDPSEIGHTQSHGCIRLTNWDALELAGMIKAGTPAILEE